MDNIVESERMKSFYLRTAQIIRKIKKSKTTMKSEVYKTDSPNRYLPLIHKVLLNYDTLHDISKEVKIVRDEALGCVLCHEILAVNIEAEEWKQKMEAALGDKTLKELNVRTYVRVNTLKASESEIVDKYALKKTCIPGVYEVDRSKNDGKASIYEDKEMLSKLVFQSLPSCLPAYVLSPEEGSVVIDATAAPGNKTTHLASIMNNSGKIYAFDRCPSRIKILCRRVKEYGATNIEVKRQDFLRVSPDSISPDYILLDPSCSGSGIHLDYEKNSERIASLHNIQAMLINHALKFKPKKLVFSTCSFHAEEGEEVIKEALEKNDDYEVEPIGDFWEERGHPGYSFSDLLARSSREDGNTGFFVALLRRKDSKS